VTGGENRKMIVELAVVVVVILWFIVFIKSLMKAWEDKKITAKEAYKLLGLTMVLIIGLVAFANSFYEVGVGNAAIVIDPITKSMYTMYGPAWALKAPWAYTATLYYATDTYEDTIPCFSKDQLEMAITVQLRWQLNQSKLVDLYKSYPRLDYEQTAVDSIMEETIRFVTKEYTALETIEYRQIVAEKIETEVFKKISEEPSLESALTYMKFDLKNIGYPHAYTAAIEDKLVKEQQKIAANFERERIIILANASAQEVIIKAGAEATAKVIVANGTREAIELILEASGADPNNATRIAELYLWVETLKQIAPDIDTFLMVIGKDGIPIMIPIGP